MKTTEILAAFFFHEFEQDPSGVADWFDNAGFGEIPEDFENFIEQARKEMAEP